MAFKFVVLSCLVVVATAGLLPASELSYSAPVTYTSHALHADHLAYTAPVTKYAAPTYAAPVTKIAAVAPDAKIAGEEYDTHPQYSFSYDIQDGHTGDSKTAHETRDGDVVKGSYSVVDPDGTKRTVDYTADPHNGFNAVVRREPVAHVAKVAAPVAYEAPVAKFSPPVAYEAPVPKIAAPVAYEAPVGKIATPVAYEAPVAKFAAPVAYATSLAKIAAPVAYAAGPVVHTAPVFHEAPVGYAAPVAKIAYSAPISYSAPVYHH